MRGVGDANGDPLGEFPQPTAKHKRYVRAQEQTKVREKGGRRRRNDVGGGCGAVRSKIEGRGGLGRNG